MRGSRHAMSYLILSKSVTQLGIQFHNALLSMVTKSKVKGYMFISIVAAPFIFFKWMMVVLSPAIDQYLSLSFLGFLISSSGVSSDSAWLSPGVLRFKLSISSNSLAI